MRPSKSYRNPHFARNFRFRKVGERLLSFPLNFGLVAMDNLQMSTAKSVPTGLGLEFDFLSGFQCWVDAFVKGRG